MKQVLVKEAEQEEVFVIIPPQLYKYLELFKRILKTEVLSGTNETIYYISDNFVQVRNNSGVFNTTYYYADGVLLAENSSSGKRYYHPDHLGSTNLITNSTGSIVEETFYLPFGDILEGGDESRYGYNSKEKDGTGLNYYGARYYKSTQGQFVQADPIIQDMYDPQLLNRYSYVLNNPYKYTDPTGESPHLAIAVASGAAVGLITGAIVYYNTGDSKKAVIAGSISGLATTATIATLGIGTAAIASATTTSSELTIAGLTAARLYAIGQTADLAEQRYVEGKSDKGLLYSNAAIAGGVNAIYSAASPFSGVKSAIKDSFLRDVAFETGENFIQDFIGDEIKRTVNNKNPKLSKSLVNNQNSKPYGTGETQQPGQDGVIYAYNGKSNT